MKQKLNCRNISTANVKFLTNCKLTLLRPVITSYYKVKPINRHSGTSRRVRCSRSWPILPRCLPPINKPLVPRKPRHWPMAITGWRCTSRGLNFPSATYIRQWYARSMRVRKKWLPRGYRDRKTVSLRQFSFCN